MPFVRHEGSHDDAIPVLRKSGLAVLHLERERLVRLDCHWAKLLFLAGQEEIPPQASVRIAAIDVVVIDSDEASGDVLGVIRNLEGNRNRGLLRARSIR